MILWMIILSIVNGYNFRLYAKSKSNNKIKESDLLSIAKFIQKPEETENNIYSLETKEETILQQKYPLHWFVIEESKNIQSNRIYKTTIREKEYVFWKDNNKHFTAMESYCNHRGANLAKGKIERNRIICPYHGAEFNSKGELCHIPGLNIQNSSALSPCFHQDTYPILEMNGWIYINTISKKLYEPDNYTIYIEPEVSNPDFYCLYLKSEINAPARIICENLLDIIHISYVHVFGNKENPLPLNDPFPFIKPEIPNHHGIHYFYKSGKRSFVRRIFGMPNLHIENEFILPYTVISRVRFGKSTKTIITFSLPKNKGQTTLFMKVYRNFVFSRSCCIFGTIYNFIMNRIITNIVRETIREDVKILESIRINGKYNVKYDRFPYLYRQLHDKL